MAKHNPFLSAADSARLTDAITIRYTLAEADPGYLLTKRIWVGANGALVKQAAANPVRGIFTDIEHMRHRRRYSERLCEGPALAVIASGDHRRPAAEPVVATTVASGG